MALIKRIHCQVDAEPRRFHDAPDAYAVNLSFECFSDDLADEPAAREAFEQFLELIGRGVRFVQYEVGETALGEPRPVRRQLPGGKPASVTDLMTWLASRAPASGPPSPAGTTPLPPERFWTSPNPTGAVTEIPVETAGAGPLLRAAQAWNAPVGHRLGLTHLVWLAQREKDGKPEQETPKEVVLPFFGDGEPPAPIGFACAPALAPLAAGDAAPCLAKADGNGLLDCFDELGSGIAEVACRTAVPKPAHSGTLDGRLTEDGYFRINPRAEELRRLLSGFEQRAASLMSVTHSLAPRGKVLDQWAAEDREYERLFDFERDQSGAIAWWAPAQPADKAAPKVARLPYAVAWAAAAGLVASLDPVVIAIMKPVARDASEGEVLAPLVSAIHDELERPSPALATFPGHGTILKGIRDTLRLNSPLIVERQAETDTNITAPTAKSIAAALRHVYSLPDKAETATPPETELLLKLLDHFQEHAETQSPPPVDIGKKLVDAMGDATPLGFLLRILFDMEARLAEESGAEAAILRLIETAARHDRKGGIVADRSVPALLAATLGCPPDAVGKAWTSYRARLESAFNGAEAVRRGAGIEFVNAIFLALDGGQRVTGPSPTEVAALITSAHYYPLRLANLDWRSCFEPIVKRLLRLPPPAFPPLDPPRTDRRGVTWLQRHLFRAYEAATGTILDLAGSGARFIPDTTPQPLPIQIAGDVTGQSFETFLDDFNGVAVAIRRVDPDSAESNFAHANLAELRWGPAQGEGERRRLQVPTALHPILPTVSDGRGPIFVEYHGLPFADARFADVQADPAKADDGASRDPFYTADVVSDLHGQPALPRLAYGCWFQSFAFPLTNAGTLPRIQQASADTPWLPAAPAEPSDPAGAEIVARSLYQRRTAIGELMMQEKAPADGERVGKGIRDVVPLASDYPRVSVSATQGAPGTVDLYREADGVGTLAFAMGPRPSLVTVALQDIRVSAGAKRIELRLFDRPATAPDDPGQWLIDLGAVIGSVTVTFVAEADTPQATGAVGPGDISATDQPEVTVRVSKIIDGGEPSDVGTLLTKADRLFWLRLVLTTEGRNASMSFAAPEGPKGSRPTPPLLLLAPDIPGTWSREVATRTMITVQTPRVGYLDFQRWMANARLRDAAFGSTESDRAHALTFERGLMTLYQMRHLDPKLARLFDRLPDPAVERLRVTLCGIDRLPDAPDLDAGVGIVELAPDKKTIFKSLAREFSENWTNDRPKAIRGLIRSIEQDFSFSIDIEAKAASLVVNERHVVASVPAGTVAHLTVEAMVKRSLFGDRPSVGEPAGVIHPGLLQYASRMDDAHVAFPAASLCVEAMTDAVPPWEEGDAVAHNAIIALADRMIALEPAASARRYDIVSPAPDAAPEDRDLWRLYSHVTVLSQRWRPTGRPAYRTLNPKIYEWNADPEAVGRAGATALRIGPKAAGKGSSSSADPTLHDFEDEIFFDRPNADADPSTQRLAPLTAKTILQSIIWDSPSATYWRHRFILRSRYAGALLKPSRREVGAFPPVERKGQPRRRLPETWTMRAAMLADLSRIQLTRPQLRALIPLTTAAGGGPPPILAILQEPPFSRGGLADRISAELKTGFGYGFENGSDTVEILDARKEIGPDPRLTYVATQRELVLRLGLGAEGPVGLTFDATHAGAPAFPNSMYALTPIVPGDGAAAGTLEEHFLGIAMQRYLDPDWLPEAPALLTATNAAEKGLDAERCWWIDMPSAPAELLLGFEAQTGSGKVLSHVTNKEQIVIRGYKQAIDGVDGSRHRHVEIAALPIGTGIGLLHQPIAPGRYALSVFAMPSANEVAQGASSAPLMMASFEWSPPKASSGTGGGGASVDGPEGIRLELPAGAVIRPTIASAPTFLAWSRTSRDFERATLGRADRKPDARIAISDLVVRGEKDGLTFTATGSKDPLHLTSSTESSPFPIHVHRHLGFVLTKLREEPGRPIEDHVTHGLFVGRVASPEKVLGKNDRMNLRLVEVETPAAILCGAESSGIPQIYRKHYFDLVATGFGRVGASRSDPATGETSQKDALKLFIRAVGGSNHLEKFKRITLIVTPAPNGGAGKTFALAFDLTRPIRGIELCVHSESAYVRLIDLKGEVIAVERNAPSIAVLKELAEGIDGSHSGFFLTVTAPSMAGEFWCDVSMLHGRASPAGGLDLRWMFSWETASDIALAFQPEALATMTEAQARLVSVSPPITVAT